MDNYNGGKGDEGLISRLVTSRKIRNSSTVKRTGNNTSVIDYGNDLTVVSASMFNEGIHFSLVYNPLKHLGYKSAVKGFSGIYARNAKPEQLMVSLALSSKINTAMVEEFYEGTCLACDVYGVDLTGGDVTSSLTGMSISCTALGRVAAGEIVHRSGAGTNDLICVTGDFGAAYLGLQVLERERLLFEKNGAGQPVLEGYDYIIGRQLRPEARKDIILILKEMGVRPTSMTDTQDGLSGSIMQLCMDSGRGCRIYPERIPVHPVAVSAAEEFNIEPVVAALHGGEDYELLFTLRQSDYPKIASCEDVKIIGHIVDETKGMYMVTGSGEVEMQAVGWNRLL